jgi:transcriptional regulator with XRE-family HTH domain
MPRTAPDTLSTLARVRRHYGLQQRELAALLGISPALAHQVEAGRRALSPAVAGRLAPFEAALPPPGAAAEAARLLAEARAAADYAAPLPPPPPGPYAPAPLARRRAACLHEARALRARLRGLAAQAAVAARWAAALPGLRAALPPPPPEAAPAATREQARLRYVHAWLATVPLALPPEALAAYHLLHQRALALEAEAAGLGQLLAGGAPSQDADTFLPGA